MNRRGASPAFPPFRPGLRHQCRRDLVNCHRNLIQLVLMAQNLHLGRRWANL
jgi:hypothetical protein